MEPKFKIGDRVRIIADGIPFNTKENRRLSPIPGLRGTEGVVTYGVSDHFDYRVAYPDKLGGKDHSFFFDAEHLELLPPEPMDPDFTLDEIEKAQEIIEG